MGNIKCKSCKDWIFSKTLCSSNKFIWHCRHGFLPSCDCQSEALYNNNIIREYYRKHPEYLQLKFKFK